MRGLRILRFRVGRGEGLGRVAEEEMLPAREVVSCAANCGSV